MLASGGDRTDVRGLEHGRNMGAADRRILVVGMEDHGLECLLAQPLRREPGITEHRAGRCRVRQVEFHRDAEKHLQELLEGRRH